MSAKILTIDAGNTRVKWGLFDATGKLLEQGACLHSALPDLRLPHADEVVISNVAGSNIETQLNQLLSQPATKIKWIQAEQAACGVQNSYSQPNKLGTDRWAALIAAWHLQQSPCVVVNAGTAITIDALNDAIFIGGLIMPGVDLMQQSLYLATAQLPIEGDRKSDIEIFATNTQDAIYAGTLYAITGAINQMAQELGSKSKQTPYILINGGNAPIIYNQLRKTNLVGDVTNQVIIVDNLVLQGLFLLRNLS